MECQATRFPSLAQAGLENSKVGLTEALQELGEGLTAGESVGCGHRPQLAHSSYVH